MWKFFSVHGIPNHSFCYCKAHQNSFVKTLCWESHIWRYNQLLSTVLWWMCSGYGIHSLLFVIKLFGRFIFLFWSNHYMVFSILITISLPYSVPTIPCAHLRGSSFGEAEKIYVLVVELLSIMKKTQQGIAIWKYWLRSIIYLISITA